MRRYETERRRIDRLCERDLEARWQQPTNPHGTGRGDVLAKASDLIAGAAIIGYHCTRLHGDEIDSIRRDGLLPLSAALAEERVRRRVAAGDLSVEVADLILSKSRADDRHLPERRTGMIWFVFTVGSGPPHPRQQRAPSSACAPTWQSQLSVAPATCSSS